MTVQKAFKNIKGLHGLNIEVIRDFQEKGIKELGLTPTHVYMGRFGKKQFESMSIFCRSYASVMPEAHWEMLQLAYTAGATAGALSNYVPHEDGILMGGFVSRLEGGRLAQTCKAARDAAEAEHSRVDTLNKERNTASKTSAKGL